MKKIMVVFLLMIALSSWAQTSVFRPDMLMNQFNGFKNLEMNHSVSFSSGVSSNSNSFYMSTYTNHLKYQFGPKLEMKLDLNFVNLGTATHQSGIDFSGNGDNSSLVVPEFELKYKPSGNTEIKLIYRTAQPFNTTKQDYFTW